MPIHLVRHAHAGKRTHWKGKDSLRPLSRRGKEQAEWLVRFLGPEPITRIVSSPYVRCVQTVEPLAVKLGLEVEVSPLLAEGADAPAALELVLELERTNGVACSHGDVIPQVLRRLIATGTAVDGPLLDQKGSVWVLDAFGGEVRAGHYVPPGA